MPNVPNGSREVQNAADKCTLVSLQITLCIKLLDTCEKIFTAEIVREKYALETYYLYYVPNNSKYVLQEVFITVSDKDWGDQ